MAKKTPTEKAYKSVGDALCSLRSVNWMDKELRTNEINIYLEKAEKALWKLHKELESRL